MKKDLFRRISRKLEVTSNSFKEKYSSLQKKPFFKWYVKQNIVIKALLPWTIFYISVVILGLIAGNDPADLGDMFWGYVALTIGGVGFYYYRAYITKCSKCGVSFKRSRMDKEFINSRQQTYMKQMPRWDGGEGFRHEQRIRTTETYKVSYQCQNCGHEWWQEEEESHG